MIMRDDFYNDIKNYFNYLVTEFDCKICNERYDNSLLFEIEYCSKKDIIVSISYDVRNDFIQIILFIKKNGMMPDYDDKSHTIHLTELNKKILPLMKKLDFENNNKYFSNFAINKGDNLLKQAKDLRLCLYNVSWFG